MISILESYAAKKRNLCAGAADGIRSQFEPGYLCALLRREYSKAAEQKGVLMDIDLEPGIVYRGVEAELRQMICVLIENAVKYCDSGGNITLQLRKGRRPILSVTNTYCTVSMLELDSLFDRFYRADKARTAGSGFGIGLSIAKAVAENHNADIYAENINDAAIRFVVKL